MWREIQTAIVSPVSDCRRVQTVIITTSYALHRQQNRQQSLFESRAMSTVVRSNQWHHIKACIKGDMNGKVFIRSDHPQLKG